MSGQGWRGVMGESVAAALGQEQRSDPVLPGTGGPAGNARLTAWTGLVLLVLFVAELVTLLDVRGLIRWHLALGVILVPPALLKTGSTGWRILRYYRGDRAYRQAGPPPLVLRVLGPLVVLGSLTLLGSGVALVWLGDHRSRESLFTVVGQRVDVLTVHQVSFVLWAVVTGLHVLGRLLLAARTVARGPGAVPGPVARGALVVGSLVVAALCAVLVLAHPGGWTSQDRFGGHDDGRPPGAARPPAEPR
ncbi:MAG TPA: hypothetical protein VH857_05045 [Actinomycetes bacterium]|jgi:hypothetical protein|nr:hypothetical protein [Actinomycetes bacterium]